MKHTALHDCLRLALTELDRLINDNPTESLDWKRGVESSRASLRSLILAHVVRPRTQLPLEPGSLAERVVAWCRVRPASILTDEEVCERFDPGMQAGDVFHHLQEAILHQYLETTVINRQRGYRRFGSSRELDARR